MCGSGNNGGDGIAVGRLLLEKGAQVTVVLAGNPDHCTEETKEQIRIFQAIGGTVEREIPQEATRQYLTPCLESVFPERWKDGMPGSWKRMNEMEGSQSGGGHSVRD